MQNTFFNRELGFGKWNTAFCLLWHNIRNLHKSKLGLSPNPLGSAQGYSYISEMGRNDALIFFTQMQFC